MTSMAMAIGFTPSAPRTDQARMTYQGACATRAGGGTAGGGPVMTLTDGQLAILKTLARDALAQAGQAQRNDRRKHAGELGDEAAPR
jgi:hypothetical protein